MTYRIDLEGCINCGWCRRVCPTDTIVFFITHRRTHLIEPEGCIDCGICAKVCPVNVISHDESYLHDTSELESAKQKARERARRDRQAKLQRRARAAAAADKVAAMRAAS